MTLKRITVAVALFVAIAIGFVAYAYLADRSTPAEQQALAEVTPLVLDQIKDDFNRAIGQVRVIALLSPT